MPEVIEAPSESVILRNVSWHTYESYLNDFEDRRVPRLTFDRGLLEIISPSAKHENYNFRLNCLIVTLAEIWDLEVVAFGSTTFRHADLESGFEPDASFYIQNASAMIGVDKIDLGRGDLPPDLIIELDLTQSGVQKLPLYARLGVAEVWCINRFGGATFQHLEADGYEIADSSAAFTRLRSADVSELLSAKQSIGTIAWNRQVRAWALDRL